MQQFTAGSREWKHSCKLKLDVAGARPNPGSHLAQEIPDRCRRSNGAVQEVRVLQAAQVG